LEIGGNTAMHRATEKNMIDVMQMFITYGGDPTVKNKAGFTCLHIAAREGRSEIVKLLINSGTDMIDFNSSSRY
jgi:ankyrin repeat protein